ncbi:hypothetical protein BSKO_08917 [Bryopsis sp. KO-2023]|nr:hypothetical protein BSKO_08917 [Bryopsis sp. KO-2023]
MSTNEADKVSESDGNPPVVFPKRRNRGNIRKRSTFETDAGEGESVEGNAVVHQPKQRKTFGFTTRKEDKKETEMFNLTGSRAIQQGGDQGATRVLETETEYDKDARAIREKVLKSVEGMEEQPSGVYKGLNNYVDYSQGMRKERSIAQEKGSGAHGPLRGSMYVRSSVRVDYQPDICKDYKETGFCSYGDACKFLHDRGDYKSGWEMERDFEERNKRNLDALLKNSTGLKESDSEDGKSDDDDDLPFACFICRKPWEELSSAVSTRCSHYFCEPCVLKHSQKSTKCYVCNTPTGGLFNVAQDILKKKAKMKTQQDAKEQGPASEEQF